MHRHFERIGARNGGRAKTAFFACRLCRSPWMDFLRASPGLNKSVLRTCPEPGGDSDFFAILARPPRWSPSTAWGANGLPGNAVLAFLGALRHQARFVACFVFLRLVVVENGGASDRHGWRECQRIAGANRALCRARAAETTRFANNRQLALQPVLLRTGLHYRAPRSKRRRATALTPLKRTEPTLTRRPWVTGSTRSKG